MQLAAEVLPGPWVSDRTHENGGLNDLDSVIIHHPLSIRDVFCKAGCDDDLVEQVESVASLVEVLLDDCSFLLLLGICEGLVHIWELGQCSHLTQLEQGLQTLTQPLFWHLDSIFGMGSMCIHLTLVDFMDEQAKLSCYRMQAHVLLSFSIQAGEIMMHEGPPVTQEQVIPKWNGGVFSGQN